MDVAAKKNRLFMEISSSKKLIVLPTDYGELYQHLLSELTDSVHRKKLLRTLGNKLVVMAEKAHALRKMGTLEEVSRLLTNLPLSTEYKAIGRYYLALCINRFGRGDIKRAADLLEGIATKAPLQVKLKALQSLAGNFFHRGDFKSALSLYTEASYANARYGILDPYTAIGTQRMVAVINSIDGNHRDAVNLLETLFPLAHSLRSVYPHIYYDYLNSFAVELGEVGRLEEAQNVSKIAVASPYASAYPEWRETEDELKIKALRSSRSCVAIRRPMPSTDNLVQFSEYKRDEQYQASASGAPSQPAKVLYLKKHSNTSENRDAIPENNFIAQKLRRMSRDEKLCAIMRAIYADDAPEAMLEKMLETLRQFPSRSNSKN